MFWVNIRPKEHLNKIILLEQEHKKDKAMDFFAVSAIFCLFIAIAMMYYWPELIIGIQLFSTPIIGNALLNLGLKLGAIFMIFSLVIASFIIILSRNKQARLLPSSFIEIMVIIFISWVLITLTYTPSLSYGTTKLLFLVIVCFPCVYMAKLLCDTPAKLHKTFTVVGWYAIFLLIYYVAYVIANDTGETIRIRSSFFGPLPLGYAVASMVPFIFYVATTTHFRFLRIVFIAAIPIAILLIIETGSRGPLLAIIAAFVFSLLRIQYLVRVTIGFTVCTAAAYFYLSNQDLTENQGLGRILGETDAADKSSQGRIELFSSAWEQFLQFPLFGQGSGSFSYFFNFTDERIYAHNSYLEIAGEFGLVGLVMFFTILALCLVQILKLRDKSEDMLETQSWSITCIQMLFIIGFINSTVSFSLSGQRILFVSIGLIAATTFWHITQTRHSKN